ncbi:MAG: hypothetical protein Ct9H300mP14_13240 [Gammaproteobacteria bacterium]|nr:MAG: hypothetical protein Ct9H300mP14_13240 [Gammaproteobacteria bacterium]
MSTQPRPRIGHIGLSIRDADVMKAFTHRSWASPSPTTASSHNFHPMMFLSTNPEEHHEIVLIGGRPDDADYSAAQQLSFLLESLTNFGNERSLGNCWRGH